MDLRGLESIQWRGFSDREIQQLHRKNHGNVRNMRKEKVSRTQDEVDVPKADQKEDDGKDDHHSCENNIITKAVLNGKDNETDQTSDAALQDVAVNEETSDAALDVAVNEETSDAALQDVAVNEADLAKQQASIAVSQQEKQKLIEEENKRKRTLIEQTLQDRAHQHRLETKMLASVKVGLNELERIVSKDVKTLRDRIEEADRVYNSAKKRFERAEAEYIAAKMELFKWSEQKELLSEHLCIIIHQNESRKAEKLSELLKSLHLEDSKEEKLKIQTDN